MVITMALALGLTGLASVIVITGLRDDVQVSDVGIVLGSKVMADGAPSSRLRARLDRAGALYRQGQFAHVIVSGGTGVEGYSEARVMAHYLTDRYQVPAAAIILDEQGVDTAATARNSAALMQAHHFTSALVVTQYFHILRSRYALQQAGIRTVHTAHAHYFDTRDVYSTAREVIALPVYWLRSQR
jgi:vancomycin permeability regulator SanA